MKPNNLIVALVLAISSCVQIPQESIKLSKMLGEDLKEIQQSHISLVNLHYDDLENNINAFVDDVYAPYQISKLVGADIQDMKDGLDDTLSGMLAAAPNDSDAAKNAFEFMDFFVRMVRDEIENYRSDLLNPIQKQRREILNQLHISYGNVMSANASITAHLSSIKKVKDAQNDLLNQLGVERDINTELGLKMAEMSSKVNEALHKAKEIDEQSDDAIVQFNDIKEKIVNLTN